MKRVSHLFRFALPGILALAIFGFGAPQDQTQPGRGHGPATMNALLRHAIPGTRDLQLIVEMTDPPMARAFAGQPARLPSGRSALMQGRNRLQMDSQQAIDYRNKLARGRQPAEDHLRQLSGAQIQGTTDVVMNSIIVRVPVEHYFEVRRTAGVKKVYFSRYLRMNLDAAAQTHNAAALWARVAGGSANAGAGQKIGIIDTGIDNTNPMFADSTPPTPSSYPPGFPKVDSFSNSPYTNHKVIVARDYLNLLNRQFVTDARDEVGHGTFVAGCAAGKLYNAPKAQISGMAPGAYLGSYKIFGTPGINDFTTTAAVLAGINDAVADGMDVINLSLGALDYLPPSEDPEVDAINSAIAAGVVVCLAAGNEGPDTHSINSPGSADDAISVGAVWNSRIFASQLNVGGPGVPSNLQTIAYQNGNGPSIASPIPATLVADVAALDGTGLACSALPGGSLNGNIALIQRGTCTFLTKVNNAAAAGARAVVVYDNVAGQSLTLMGGLSGTSTPAVMIFRTDGLALKNYAASTAGVTVSIGVSTSASLATPMTPVLASDSSRGPSADFGIKPDLVAVGWEVYSAAQNQNSGGALYDPSRFTISQGTSFSTPMVSGAAAAVMQLFPTLNPAGVKSVLANTAARVTLDGITPASIVQAGNGLLNMGNAAGAVASFSPSSLNYGVQGYSSSISTTRTLSITNISGSADQFSVSADPIVAGPAISFSATSTGQIQPGATANIDIRLDAAAPLSGGFQGFVKVQSSNTATIYSIPYWAGLYVPDPTRILTVNQSSSDPGVYKNLSDALAAANPGNVIEFADSGSYTLSSPADPSLPAIKVSTNAQGLPLHGITIRAAAGQTPVIDGGSANAIASIQVVGLHGVLFQGLTISGGETGLDLLQPSLSLPLSVSVDHCNIINQAASTTSSGVVLESGGDLDITYSTISGSVSAGVVLLSGGQLTMSHSTVQNNGSDGIDGVDANVQLIQSTVTLNSGQGVFLVDCSGTLTGNTITQNSGVFGDGVQLEDGSLTFSNNTFDSNTGAAIALFAGTISTPSGSRPGPGPTVTINGNTMHANDFGLLIDQAQNAKMDGNLLADNVQGIQVNGTSTALLTNNIITRSTDLTTGDGLNVSNGSTVAIVNCDFYLNRRKGISIALGSAVTVANSIISGNAAGDLSGMAAANVQYCLIGDGTFAGSNHNFSGDPKFADPVNNDFSLAAGSPAIDAGSNAVAQLPFRDYSRKFRVASAGANPGEGVADVGAIESSSLFPLIYPLMLNGFSSVIGDDYTTGLAVMNSNSAQDAPVYVGYRPDGTLFPAPFNPSAPIPLPAEGQVAELGYQPFGLIPDAGEVGGVLAGSARELSGFFLVFDRDFQRIADGVDVSSNTSTQFLFLRHEFDGAGKAVYALFNPGMNSATVNASVVDTGGNTIDQLTQPIILPPKGHQLFTFSNVAASSGSIRITSDRPITGLEMFGNTREIAALRAAEPGTEARLFFPHVVVNGGYTSNLGVVNGGSTPVNLTLTAYGENGMIMGSPAQRTVAANGQLFESAASLFNLPGGDIATGYVLVTGDQPGITGFCAFQYADGSVQANAAVPSQSIPHEKLLFSHIANQIPAKNGGNFLTGVALLNPFGTRVSYTLRVFDNTGLKVAEMTDYLEPHAKVARVLSYPLPGYGFFTQPLSLGGGHIEVTTDYQLLGFELFFTERLTQIAAVMAQYPNQ